MSDDASQAALRQILAATAGALGKDPSGGLYPHVTGPTIGSGGMLVGGVGGGGEGGGSEGLCLSEHTETVSALARKASEQQRAGIRPEGTDALYVVVQLNDRADVWRAIEHGFVGVSSDVDRAISMSNKVILIVSCMEAFGPCVMGYGLACSKPADAHELNVAGKADLPVAWRRLVRIGWIKIGSLPFKGGTDGEVLHCVQGVALCNAVDASSADIQQTAAPVNVLHTRKTTAALDVSALSLEDYTLIVLNKRRQQLRIAASLRAQISERVAQLPCPAPTHPPALAVGGQLAGLTGSAAPAAAALQAGLAQGALQIPNGLGGIAGVPGSPGSLSGPGGGGGGGGGSGAQGGGGGGHTLAGLLSTGLGMPATAAVAAGGGGGGGQAGGGAGGLGYLALPQSQAANVYGGGPQQPHGVGGGGGGGGGGGPHVTGYGMGRSGLPRHFVKR